MFSKSMWGMLALVAVLTTVGCMSTNTTVRGQAPLGPDPVSAQAPIIGSAPGYGQGNNTHLKHSHDHLGVRHHDFSTLNKARDPYNGFERGYWSGNEGYAGGNPGMVYSNHPRIAGGVTENGCPYCQYGAACPIDGCKSCGYGCKHGHPHHHMTYRHVRPDNLVYPQQQAPAAMVQYPYYTFRGPTDFFMK